MRAEIEQDAAVKKKQDADREHDEPDLGGLFEVLPEGAEEHRDDILLLAADDLDADIVERGGRSPDRKDRERTDHPQEVQQAGLAARQDDLAELAVIREELSADFDVIGNLVPHIGQDLYGVLGDKIVRADENLRQFRKLMERPGEVVESSRQRHGFWRKMN